MTPILTKNLTEHLTLLVPGKEKDGEGGWKETWRNGPQLWASLWPLLDKQATPHYRVTLRAGLELPSKVIFLWHLRYATKRLRGVTSPHLVQNHFLSLTVVEDHRA